LLTKCFQRAQVDLVNERRTDPGQRGMFAQGQMSTNGQNDEGTACPRPHGKKKPPSNVTKNQGELALEKKKSPKNTKTHGNNNGKEEDRGNKDPGVDRDGSDTSGHAVPRLRDQEAGI